MVTKKLATKDILTSLEKPVEVGVSYQMPSRVRIMGREVSISKCSESEDFSDAGHFDEHKLAIKVLEGQLPIEEADTLLHETIHAIDYWSDLGMSEHQVRVLATALIGLFQDHPEFAKFVTRPLNRTEL